MIINLSNHPKETWQEKQLQAALAYGELVDLPFPQLPGSMTGEELEQTATSLLHRIREMKPDAVIVMGEFSLVFMLVDALLDEGIPILTAASERNTVEQKGPDGTKVKIARFDFVGFRPYRRLSSRNG